MELWDMYDSKNKRTGRIMKRNDCCLKKGEYHLTVLGVIATKEGKFLITQRDSSKAWAAGWWEVSGGAVMAGEDSKDAVIREIKEETGLDVSFSEGEFLFTYHRENLDEGDNYFVDV
ncbi:MAG: NUDIX hydrolase, partial [Lachnospiraceae bacterium]|nr:NUDIX hydrolase [Lachnospiraceae bacterium]